MHNKVPTNCLINIHRVYLTSFQTPPRKPNQTQPRHDNLLIKFFSQESFYLLVDSICRVNYDVFSLTEEPASRFLIEREGIPSAVSVGLTEALYRPTELIGI